MTLWAIIHPIQVSIMRQQSLLMPISVIPYLPLSMSSAVQPFESMVCYSVKIEHDKTPFTRFPLVLKSGRGVGGGKGRKMQQVQGFPLRPSSSYGMVGGNDTLRNSKGRIKRERVEPRTVYIEWTVLYHAIYKVSTQSCYQHSYEMRLVGKYKRRNATVLLLHSAM